METCADALDIAQSGMQLVPFVMIQTWLRGHVALPAATALNEKSASKTAMSRIKQRRKWFAPLRRIR
jgi:hypothetical protein